MCIFTFSELCKKEIICISNGRKLGYPTDIRFDAKCGQILDLIVPVKSTLALFSGKDCVRIPWCEVERIGEDVIWIKKDYKYECHNK